MKENWRTWGAAICLVIAILIGIYGKTRAQDIICRPFVYENLSGQPPIGAAVTFSDYEGDHVGLIVAYYYLPCWPGYPVFELDDIAFVIDYGKRGPIGNEIDVILNRDGFDLVNGE